MSRQKSNPYYGLKFISLLYKILTVLTVIFVIGGIGYLSLAAVNSPNSDYADFQWWLQRVVLLTVGGGMLALLLYVVAQLIDVQFAVNSKVDWIWKAMHENPNALKTYETMGQKLVDEMEKIRVIVQQQSRMSRLQNEPQKSERDA